VKINLKTNVINDLIESGLTLNLQEKASLQNLLDQLVETYGIELKDRIFTKGRLNPNLTILVNGKPISDVDLERELPQPCEISLIQMLSGGSWR
jgi:hypothetical protein